MTSLPQVMFLLQSTHICSWVIPLVFIAYVLTCLFMALPPFHTFSSLDSGIDVKFLVFFYPLLLLCRQIHGNQSRHIFNLDSSEFSVYIMTA